jgi:hypothetical protein
VRPSSELWKAGCAPDIGFLQSWLEDDSSGENKSQGKLNWGAISGLVLSLGISAGFWAGVVLLVQRIWK